MTIKIQVLGSGCKKCKELYERTKIAVHDLNKTLTVEYVTDVQKIMEMGVLSTPVLAIDGKPVLMGTLPDVEKIKNIISNHTACTAQTNSKDGAGCSSCSCNGPC